MKLNFKKEKKYLIAEIGWNFMGKISLAKSMIDAAKKSGADFVKFQIWNPDNLETGDWDHDGRRKIYQKAYLNEKRYKQIHNYCKKIKIGCFASIFSETEINFYNKINKDLIKIPSHEAYNIKLIDKCLKKFKQVIISAGALKKRELIKLNKYKNNKKVLVMHCVSSYPLVAENCNFGKLDYLKKNFKKVGYSGHYSGIEDALYAINNGAVFIEKHFTTNKSLPGRDNKFAILPDELKRIKDYIEISYRFEIQRGLDLQKCEKDIYSYYRGRWAKKN